MIRRPLSDIRLATEQALMEFENLPEKIICIGVCDDSRVKHYIDPRLGAYGLTYGDKLAAPALIQNGQLLAKIRGVVTYLGEEVITCLSPNLEEHTDCYSSWFQVILKNEHPVITEIIGVNSRFDLGRDRVVVLEKGKFHGMSKQVRDFSG